MALRSGNSRSSHKMLNPHMSRCLHHMLIMCLLIFAGSVLSVASATDELDLPPILLPCDLTACPPDADMQCPEDSAIREIREINAVDLLSSNAMGTGSGSGSATTEKVAYNSSTMTDELFAQCCLSKKCLCNTCYIPDCTSDEVVVELQPEAMETPGQCCGKYECKREPNCTEVWNTDYYWLQSCQRCMCTSGQRICHQTCDEGTNAMCESKTLNTFFKDGQSWEDGCYQCECVKGEEKCVIPFCGRVSCPSERQVQLKNSCCPVCWPKGEPMPHEKPRNDDDGYDYEQEIETEAVATAAETASTTTTTSSAITHPAELLNYESSSSSVVTAPPAPPCQLHDFPKVVEVVHHNKNIMTHVYKGIIGILVIIIVAMGYYILLLRAKQRSYRPVYLFDNKV